MERIDELERRVRTIEERNANVERDKAWETSWARTALVGALTYVVIAVFFSFARLPGPLLNAAVPALAFVLSTRTVPLVKRAWLRRRARR